MNRLEEEIHTLRCQNTEVSHAYEKVRNEYTQLETTSALAEAVAQQWRESWALEQENKEIAPIIVR